MIENTHPLLVDPRAIEAVIAEVAGHPPGAMVLDRAVSQTIADAVLFRFADLQRTQQDLHWAPADGPVTPREWALAWLGALHVLAEVEQGELARRAALEAEDEHEIAKRVAAEAAREAATQAALEAEAAAAAAEEARIEADRLVVAALDRAQRSADAAAAAAAEALAAQAEV